MRRPRLVPVAAAAAVMLAGCGGAADDDADRPPAPLRLYGTDGMMDDGVGESLPDRSLLNGMKGTAPLNPLPAEFTNRLREVDPSLESVLFAGETYDAVVISALAAELAGTPDPEVVREYINAVTVGGTSCREVADCLELARDGEQFAYGGVSLRQRGFTDQGEPAAATYATLHFGRDGRIDHDRTEYVGAGDAAAVTDQEPPAPGARPTGPSFEREPLTLGGLLPETGALSNAYPPLIAGARLAIAEINDAGGVFGLDVEWIDGDSATSVEVAKETVASHLDDGVHVIIGAGASGVTEAVLPDVAAAQRILFSPSNTAASLTDAEGGAFYFRTAPPDTLQGSALADVILRDGVERVVLVARDDAYGVGLQDNAAEALVEYGLAESDVVTLSYEPPAQEGAPIPGVDQLVTDVAAAGAGGVVLIGFSEGAQIVQGLAEAGVLAEP